MNYDKLCQDCLDSDPQIRYSGVVNNKGEVVSGGNRPDVESLLSPKEVQMSIHYTMQNWEKTQNLAYKIGEEKAAIVEYEKVILISFPVGRNLLLISTTPDSNYAKIVSDVKNLISAAE